MCAVESKRACGYRKTGGAIYLVGNFIPVQCDKLPYRISHCSFCGQGIRFPRSPTLIRPDIIFSNHEHCLDEHQPCIMCQPEIGKVGYLLGVGKEYSPESFVTEGLIQGTISKRIHQIPRKLELGKTVVYLCHNKACDIPDDSPDELPLVKDANGDKLEQPPMVNLPKTKKGLGIFTAFIPQRLEMLFYKSEITDKLREKMAKRNISIVEIPDGDIDHAPAKLRKKLLKKNAPKQSKQPPPLPSRDSKGHFKKSDRRVGKTEQQLRK